MDMKYIYLFIFLLLIGLYYYYNNNDNPMIVSTGLPNQYPNMNLYKNDNSFIKPEHRLLHVLSSISSGDKVKLVGNCKKELFTKQTIDKLQNDYLVVIVSKIMQGLQLLTSNEYYMKNIENVYELSDVHNNKRYVIDFYIYDIKNYYTIRLVTDIVIISDDIYINYLNVLSGSNPTLLNHYDMKFNNSGLLFDSSMFHENVINLFDNYYMNRFQLIGLKDPNNTDLSKIYTLGSLLNGYYPSNVSNDTIHDYSEKGLSSYLEQYLPMNQHNVQSPSFCLKETNYWDSNGVPVPTSSNCLRNQNSTMTKYNDPYDAPGVITQRVDKNKYSWLNNPARGNIIRTSGYHI